MRGRAGRDELLDRLAPNCGSGVVVIMVGLIACLAGWQQGSAAAAALGLGIVVLPLATLVALRRIAGRIVLRQSVPARVFEGDPVEIRVTVEGPMPPPGFDLRLSEQPSVSRAWVRTLTFGEPLAGDSGRERSYRLRCEVPRGDHPAGDAYLRLGDPFGWFELRRALRTENRILVLPRIIDLPATMLRAVGIARPGLGLAAPRAGHSNEFRGLRPYRSGDPRGRVHWKQTARYGELIVREDESEQEGGVVLVLDRDLADDARGVGQATLDRAARFAASVAVAARRRGLAIGFVWGPGATERIDVAGDADVNELLESLARLRLAESPTLPASLAALGRDRDRPGRVEIVSAARSLAGLDLDGLLADLRRRGHEIGLVLVDGDGPEAERFRPPPGAEVVRIGARLLGATSP